MSDISPLDLEVIQETHRKSGYNYIFPKDFTTPLFPVRRMVTDDSGKFIAAYGLKVQAETYLWMDHDYGTPEQRWAAIRVMNKDLIGWARNIGFDSAHCVLPPEIAERFGKRLEDLGWSPARPWPMYTLQVR